MNWDQYLFALCAVVAQKSKHTRTKVGCILVGPDKEIRSTGYNGMPRLVDDSALWRYDRPQSELYFEHAERNAIYNACRHGTPLKGCTAYVPWHPCADCARGIIQAGIVEVVLDPAFEMSSDLAARWKDSHEAARVMFREAVVKVR